MAERETKDREEREEARRRKKAKPAYAELKQAAEPQISQGKQALAGMSVAEQALLSRNPQVFGAQRVEAMLELQQTYGNSYVQRLAEGSKEATLDEDIIHRIEVQRGLGKPLEPNVRSQMEASFGYDFRQVKVHTDAEAGRLSQELGAKAFTTGKDIFFKRGAYEPSCDSGARLVAHELSHVVQQEAGGNCRHGGVSTEACGLEADRDAVNLVWGGLISPPAHQDMLSICRQKEGEEAKATAPVLDSDEKKAIKKLADDVASMVAKYPSGGGAGKAMLKGITASNISTKVGNYFRKLPEEKVKIAAEEFKTQLGEEKVTALAGIVADNPEQTHSLVQYLGLKIPGYLATIAAGAKEAPEKPLLEQPLEKLAEKGLAKVKSKVAGKVLESATKEIAGAAATGGLAAGGKVVDFYRFSLEELGQAHLLGKRIGYCKAYVLAIVDLVMTGRTGEHNSLNFFRYDVKGVTDEKLKERATKWNKELQVWEEKGRKEAKEFAEQPDADEALGWLRSSYSSPENAVDDIWSALGLDPGYAPKY